MRIGDPRIVAPLIPIGAGTTAGMTLPFFVTWLAGMGWIIVTCGLIIGGIAYVMVDKIENNK